VFAEAPSISVRLSEVVDLDVAWRTLRLQEGALPTI